MEAVEGTCRSADSKIRVLWHDHAVVREGTRRLLEEEPDIEVVGEASDGLEAIEKAEKLSPDVVAMDVSMPRMNGIDATKRIKEKNPSVQVLALTAYDDFAYVSRLLECGASGYILKSARAGEIVTAIRATALGDSVLDPGVARAIFSRIARREASHDPEEQTTTPSSSEARKRPTHGQGDRGAPFASQGLSTKRSLTASRESAHGSGALGFDFLETRVASEPKR